MKNNYSAENKVIALIEWNQAGHHQTYFRYFSSTLLSQGATVVPFCPWDPQEITDLVASCLEDEKQDAMTRFETPVSCRFPPAGGGRLAKFRRLFDQRRHFKRIAKGLEDWESRNDRKIDLVFFCCIYDPQFDVFPKATKYFSQPWSGMYFDSRFTRMPGTLRPYSLTAPRPNEIFSGRGLHSLAILDEGMIEETRAFCQNRPVVLFPDIAAVQTASTDGRKETIGDKIRSFANGRKVVGCLGHLQKTKGLLELVRAAKNPKLADIVFVFVGEANLSGLPAQEQAEIIEAWEHCSQIFCHPLKVAEPTYNSAFEACDVIAAAYNDFPNSSNTLTKAAAFSKPIVVNDGYLMAERVRRYQLGLVVPEGDQAALTDAIASLTAGLSSKITEEARWDDYWNDHSPERLGEAFESLLSDRDH